MGTLSADQIAQMGFAAVGKNVAISDRCSIYGAASITIRDHVRIDDFVILTAREPVVIGSYVHIAAFAFLSGQFGIVIEDFTGISPRATLLSGNDDFTGHSLPGPLAPPELRNLQGGRLQFGRHCLVGAHSIVLPRVSFGEGAVLGAMSLAKKSLEPWSIYAGVPARFIKTRSRDVEALGDQLLRRD